jgi:methanesulfonate monooxygenase small subunit
VVEREIERLIYRSCHCLDEEDFAGYLDLCAPDFRYRVCAHSPEIRKDMVWLDHDRKGLAALFENLPTHLRRPGKLHRHASVYDITDNGAQANVDTSLLVLVTGFDGRTTVLAAGRYEDSVQLGGDIPRLLSRTVRLETRDLGIGSHVPL